MRSDPRCWRRRAARRGLWVAALGALTLLSALASFVALAWVASYSMALPAEVVAPSRGLRLLDRHGQELARVRDARGNLAEAVPLGELSPWLVPALVAAEDQRFFAHPGIDGLAVLRAVRDNVRSGRVVSGASTVTQQLARTLFDRPRTPWGKWRELALSFRLERELAKTQILEAYFNRVQFGPRITGVGAASRAYFDKPPRALSLAEAAALVAIVRGPSRYDPERAPDRLRARRDFILERMSALGLAPLDEVERARRAPLVLHEGYVLPGAFHFVRAALRREHADVELASRSTLDGRLQRRVESAVRGFGARLAEHRASAAAVLVLDNASSAVRAYVGSPDYHARAALGQNDGVLALRQPGSTLKPFVYALGMRDLGLHAASLLPDLERSFESEDGSYLPQNFDRRFHGPVRLAPALAASLNLPALHVAERLGPESVGRFLAELGFAHLGAPREHGPGVALGAPPVQLAELTAAYAALARGGVHLPLRYFEAEAAAPARRVLPLAVARQITAILSDPSERAATFGRDGPLELDVPVAVKTGTSKGNRDNWVVGYTHEVTVGVWVGNFDGSPMLRSSGATGAGPLFHAVMTASVELHVGERPEVPGLAGEPLLICTESGELAGEACPERVVQTFWTTARPDRGCSWHDPACPGCTPNVPALYAAWAAESGRHHLRGEGTVTLAPRGVATGAEPRSDEPARRVAVTYPRAASRFVLDPHVHGAQQEVVLTARAAPDERVAFRVDGRELCVTGAPFECPWALAPGEHELTVEASDGRQHQVRFSVQPSSARPEALRR